MQKQIDTPEVWIAAIKDFHELHVKASFEDKESLVEIGVNYWDVTDFEYQEEANRLDVEFWSGRCLVVFEYDSIGAILKISAWTSRKLRIGEENALLREKRGDPTLELRVEYHLKTESREKPLRQLFFRNRNESLDYPELEIVLLFSSLVDSLEGYAGLFSKEKFCFDYLSTVVEQLDVAKNGFLLMKAGIGQTMKEMAPDWDAVLSC